MPLAALGVIQNIGTDLEKTLGIEYDFKLNAIEFFKQFMADALGVIVGTSGIVLTSADYPILYEISLDPDYKYDFLFTAPSMGFSAKEDAYDLVKEITDFLLEAIDSGLSFTAGATLNILEAELEKFLIGDKIYVGIEGEGDFHFMDYFYRWLEIVLDLLEIAI